MGRMIAAVALLLAAAGAARADGDAARGEKRFEECATCHSTQAGVNGVGPSLHDVFGRKAGGLDDFRYSPAMRRSGVTWTPQTLDTFVADPAEGGAQQPHAVRRHARRRRPRRPDRLFGKGVEVIIPD